MTQRRNNQRDLIVESVVGLSRGVSPARSTTNYSMTIEFALMELTRIEMRWIAQTEQPPAQPDELLKSALRRVRATIEEAFEHNDVSLELGTYEKQLLKKLKFPAKEIQKLGRQLADSRRSLRLGSKEESAENQSGRFVVNELGLRGAINGLLAQPHDEIKEINIEKLRDGKIGQLEGEWFPYEVLVGDFVFVIDDDGSIFVATMNFPQEILREAREMINELAKAIYT